MDAIHSSGDYRAIGSKGALCQLGRTGVAVAMGVGKGVLVDIRADAVLNAPPVIVVNMVGIGVGLGVPSVGVGDGMGVAARSA